MSVERMSQLTKRQQTAVLLVSLISMYEDCEPGCGELHVVIEDGNYDCLEKCLEECKKKGDYAGQLIGTLLMEFSIEDREIIIDQPWRVNALIESIQDVEPFI